MAFLAPILKQRLSLPFEHRRMREDMIDPCLTGANVEAIGADAESDRGKEGVDRTETVAREPRTAEPRQAFLEQFADTGDVASQCIGPRLGPLGRETVRNQCNNATHISRR